MNFDPSAFVNLEISTPLVRRPPLAEGDYLATIGEVKAAQWHSEKLGTTGLKYNVPLTLEVPPDQQDKVGSTQVKLTDGIMLDLTDGGGLDLGTGKNGTLRRYREALDMNKPGDVFSAAKMQGRLVKVKIKHELYNGDIQERPNGVTKA